MALATSAREKTNPNEAETSEIRTQYGARVRRGTSFYVWHKAPRTMSDPLNAASRLVLTYVFDAFPETR